MTTKARKLVIPSLTPEGLYRQDKRRRDWDDNERKLQRAIARSRLIRKQRLW